MGGLFKPKIKEVGDEEVRTLFQIFLPQRRKAFIGKVKCHLMHKVRQNVSKFFYHVATLPLSCYSFKKAVLHLPTPTHLAQALSFPSTL